MSLTWTKIIDVAHSSDNVRSQLLQLLKELPPDDILDPGTSFVLHYSLYRSAHKSEYRGTRPSSRHTKVVSV